MTRWLDWSNRITGLKEKETTDDCDIYWWITLLGCTGKLFTAVINTKLLSSVQNDQIWVDCMVIECRPSTNSVNYICGLIALLTQCFIKIEGSIVRLLTVVKHSADLAMCSKGQICGRNVIRNIQVARFCTVVVFFVLLLLFCFVFALIRFRSSYHSLWFK